MVATARRTTERIDYKWIVAVVFAPRPPVGRFSLVQWSEAGAAVGGLTFVVRGGQAGPSVSSVG